MHQQLLRHFQSLTAGSGPHTQLWLRITCCLTLLIPIITYFTVARKTKATSDQHFMPMTPPDYFFRVWIVIFLFTAFLMIFAAIVDCWSVNIWILFLTINVSCGFWAYMFNSGMLWAINVSVFSQFVNLIAIEAIWIFLANPQHSSLVGTAMGIIMRNLVSFILGWFVAAAALGLFLIFIHSLGLGLKWQLPLFWITAILAYIGILLYNILAVGTFKEMIGYFFTMGWALYGAFLSSYKNKGTLEGKEIQ